MSNIPLPSTYLSCSNGRCRVIHQGIPVNADTRSPEQALAAAAAMKLAVSPHVWDGEAGVFFEGSGLKREASLNALTNPAMLDDRILMDDGSVWRIGQDLTYWTIHPPKESSLPILRIYGQVELIRKLGEINAQRNSVGD